MADFDDAMLLTTSDLKPGRLRGRPMHVAEVEADGTLWLFACADGDRGREAMTDSEAYVVCQSPHHQVFLRGRVTMVGDHARIDALWNDVLDRSLPKKTDDRSLCLLRFTTEEGELWDHSAMKGERYFLDVARHSFTGERPSAPSDGRARSY
jgi:general stress protein 26